MKIYLVSKPRLEWQEFARFARDENLPQAEHYMIEPPSDGESLAEIGGRLCYMSYGKGRKGNAEYLANIISQNHWSVLEHANYGFIITGVSRALTHELVRHRHFSFSQLSQRYVDHTYSQTVIPETIAADEELSSAWLALHKMSSVLYERITQKLGHEAGGLFGKKAVNGLARGVLMESTETRIMITGNARTWREFIMKRYSPAADAEIRQLARLVLDALDKEAPHIFGDLWEHISL